MADARELTYGISFNSEDAVNDVEQLEQGLGRIDDATDRAQIGAQNCSQAMSSMGAAGTSAARDVGSAAQNMGERFEEAGDDIGDKFRKMGAQADSFGAAFKKTMAAGIKDGQSLAKSFQTGVSGAISFTQKKFTGFKNDVSKGAKAIGNAFKHPIQTIKDKLSKAIIHAADSTDALEDGAGDAEKALDDMGNTGSEAGNKVKEAISGALKAFLGIEAIKAAASAIKEFATAALDAAKAGENTAAKFATLFEGTNAAAWADNYADAVHRSTTEVKGFLVENQAMYTDLGLTKDAATDLSKITTSLAYDFGNAFKMEDADALAVIQEGIKGNSSALTEYGIKLDDATIKAQAQAMGLGENIDEMDEATLAQVRLASMIEQTSKVQQAAINDTDGLTNSTKSLKGIWANFMEDAGNKFAPVLSDFYGVIIDSWPTIEPMLMGLVEMLSEGLSQALPVILELGSVLLPVLTDVLGTVFQAALPLIDTFGSLAQVVLPPLASILQLLVETLMPPITEILNVIISLIEPLMPVIQSIAEAILPPIAELLGLIAPILEAISPVLDVIGSVLKVIGDTLGTVIGWLADGVGAVVNFFSGLFGGAKDSKDEITELNGAVNGLADRPRGRYVAVHRRHHRRSHRGQRDGAGKHHRDEGHHRPQPQDNGYRGQQHLLDNGDRRRDRMEPHDKGGRRGSHIYRLCVPAHRQRSPERQRGQHQRDRHEHSGQRIRHGQLRGRLDAHQRGGRRSRIPPERQRHHPGRQERAPHQRRSPERQRRRQFRAERPDNRAGQHGRRDRRPSHAANRRSLQAPLPGGPRGRV